MPGWLVDRIADIIFWVGIPALLLFSVIAPFLFVKKILKRRLTPVAILLSLLAAAGLLVLDFYGLYWAVVWLQGVAFCDIYGC